MAAEKCREVTGPSTEFTGSDARGIILWVVKDAKNLVGEVFGDGTSHACKPRHEKVERVPEVAVKR